MRKVVHVLWIKQSSEYKIKDVWFIQHVLNLKALNVQSVVAWLSVVFYLNIYIIWTACNYRVHAHSV